MTVLQPQNHTKKENQHKLSYIHVPTSWSLLQIYRAGNHTWPLRETDRLMEAAAVEMASKIPERVPQDPSNAARRLGKSGAVHYTLLEAIAAEAARVLT